MDKLKPWQWIFLLVLARIGMEFLGIHEVEDFYALVFITLFFILIRREPSFQETTLKPFLFGVFIYWIALLVDFADKQLASNWLFVFDKIDGLLRTVGFYLIGLAFLRVMKSRNTLINQLHNEVSLSQTLQNSLYQQAHSDELTGLGNRRSLFESLGNKIAAAESGTLLYIDVNNFKTVNDQMGHDVGDLLLQRCAQILCLNGVEAFRLGGDEFVVLLGVEDPHLWVLDLNRRSATLAQEYGVTLSIGMAKFSPDNPSTVDELLAKSDQAMYSDKKSSRIRRANRE